MFRVAFVTTHPIQYQVAWFRELARRTEVDATIFYCLLPDSVEQGDGFGLEFQWDVPLLDGYRFVLLKNVAKSPSVTHFRGCDTPGLSEAIRAGKWHAVVVNGWVVKSCLQAVLACRRHDVPCIVRGEANALRARPWWARFLHRMLLRQYSAFLVIGSGNGRFYLENGADPGALFRSPYCVDNERFKSESARLCGHRIAIRESWKIPEKAVSYVFCGKFIEKKRPLDAIKALEFAIGSLNTPRPTLHLLMVGDGALRTECERYAAERRLPVTFTGFLNQSEIAKAYVAADCLVLPSDYGETWGLVVNEAMACGRPAIVSDRVGCHPDLIRPGETGSTYPFGNVRELATRMTEFASDPQALVTMGAHARRLIEQYSPARAAEGCVQALQYIDRRGTVPAAAETSRGL